MQAAYQTTALSITTSISSGLAVTQPADSPMNGLSDRPLLVPVSGSEIRPAHHRIIHGS